MRSLRGMTVGALAWLLVVAACSVAVWYVIDAAGRDVMAVSAGPGEGPVATPETSGSMPAPEPTTPAGSATTDAPTVTATSPPSAPVVAGSIGVLGGRVGMTCSGGAPALQFATPATGWSVKVEDSGAEVKVEFRSTDGRSRSEVRGQCRGGVPAFTTAERDDGSGG